MGKLSTSDQRRLGAVNDALRAYSLSSDSFVAAAEAMAALLETDKAILYSLRPREVGDDLEVGLFVVSSFSGERWRKAFDRWLVGRGVNVAAYNPLRPEPWQRNRVFGAAELRPPDALTPLEHQLYPEVDARGHDTMRLLVCEGPSLLGWVGLVQPVLATKRQRMLLRKVLPAFGRRLRFERWVREAEVASAALPAVLEQIPAAAWLLDAGGRVLHANSAGRADLDAKATMREELRACASGGRSSPSGSSSGLRATRFGDAEGRGGVIVVKTVAEQAPSAHAAAQRLGLTRAQARVLELLARGLSNATIAAELGIAERTVEAHVTAVLAKAQVPSRAALIAAVFRR